ncbi:hypothetical protein BGZ95_000295 [Linnemannia exigua]|uniref:FAD-binding domain-containing protein n=1 Tax=Linnemannia exigua TaxID=604196 RepID=A0AAD4H9Z9_9FUNG|nr:hypothetical protein BGZ95_000295 [Linnemannia exigua]
MSIQGAGMSVGPTLLPLFEQLGIYDEFLTIGKYLTHTPNFKESPEPYRHLDHFASRGIVSYMSDAGYGQYIVARPKLYDLLLRQVPAHRILFGHRVLDFSESEDDRKVTVHLSDNNSHMGDILVGADGAYSAVRQRMYEQLKANDELPKSDQEDLPFSCTCLVGQTRILDPEEYPIIKEELCQFLSVFGKEKQFTSLLSTAQNTLCWSVIHYLDKVTSKAALEQRFRNSENSEWGAIPAQVMCDETKDFSIPLGKGKSTMGEIYALTPKEQISKVMLEEKIFDTWYHGRTVLSGDAFQDSAIQADCWVSKGD